MLRILWRRWLRTLFSSPPRGRSRPRPRLFRPWLEPLECRLAPATWIVTNPQDSGDGSFRQAIEKANGDPSKTDRPAIEFRIPSDSTHTIVIGANPLPAIARPMFISGFNFHGGENVTLASSLAPQDRPDRDTYIGLTLGGIIPIPGNYVVSDLTITGFSTGIRVKADGVKIIQTTLLNNFRRAADGSEDGVGIELVGVSRSRIASNTIGGTGTGVLIRSAKQALTAINNQVAYNYIGVDEQGTAIPNLKHGVEIDGTRNSEANLSFTNLTFNTIAGNGGHGIYIHGKGAHDNSLTNNRIGIFRSPGSLDQEVVPNGGAGVRIEDSKSNQIGTHHISSFRMGNIIAGNGGPGIDIATTGTMPLNISTTIMGNQIGIRTTSSTTVAAGNAIGIRITGVGGVTIGSFSQINDWGATIDSQIRSGLGAGNVIAGNRGAGIQITGISDTQPSTGNYVGGNFIGTDNYGTMNLGNEDGIRLVNATNNAIGGYFGNVISGNRGTGVHIEGGQKDPVLGFKGSNHIKGNRIGTSPMGRAALGNDTGIEITHSVGNSIDGNLISGNQIGITLVDTGEVASGMGNSVLNNSIGTNRAGTSALGNGLGILVLDSLDPTLAGHTQGNVIGGRYSYKRNTISGNTKGGVWFRGTGTRDNILQGNLIGTDRTGKVALPNQGDGVDIEKGASHNTIGGEPMFTFYGVYDEGAGNLISGNASRGVVINDSDENTLLGNVIGLDADGGVLPNRFGGVALSNAHNNTIGGSSTKARNVISGNKYENVLVTTGSSNNNIERNFIGLNLSGDTAIAGTLRGVSIDFGAHNNDVSANVIAGARLDNVILDGDGTDGNVVEGNAIGTNSTGTAPLGQSDHGVLLQNGARKTTVRGNTIAGSQQNVLIRRSDSPGSNPSTGNLPPTEHLLVGNRIGVFDTDTGRPDGTVGYPIAHSEGIVIESAGGNIVGKANVFNRNVISGGVRITGKGATGNFVSNNYIGVDPTGMTALGDSGSGVVLADGADNNTVGGTKPNTGNVIAGMDGTEPGAGIGVLLVGSYTSGNFVQGNRIGVAANGVTPLGNRSAGVEITDSANGNVIGGTEANTGNIIANTRQGPGIQVGGIQSGTASYNTILGNSIFNNATLGIALLPHQDGSPNGGTARSNGGLLYPVLESVTSNANGTVTISGSLQGTVRTTANYLLEFFSNPAPGPSGIVQGRTFLGRLTVGSDLTGSAPRFTQTFAANAAEGFITATATDPAGNTSEFSPGVKVSAAVINPHDGSLIRLSTTVNTIKDAVSYDSATRPAGLAAPPAGYDFPLGLLQFKVTGVTTGTPFVVTIDLAKPVSVKLAPGETAPHYYKYGPHWTKPNTFDPTPAWYDFGYDGKTGAEFSNTHPGSSQESGVFTFNRITLHLQKGARGDDDPAHEGSNELTDPGGIALPAGDVLLGDANGATSSVYQVTNTNDDGLGSLRQALVAANSDPTGALIVFHILSGEQEAGAYVIRPLSALPALNRHTGGIAIDGTTQTIFGGNTNPAGPEIVLDGSRAGLVNGLQVLSNFNQIVGLNIRHFQGSGIEINAGASYNVVAGDYLGTDATGTLALPNLQNGVVVTGGSTGNIIGGTAAGAGNVISGNGRSGVGISVASNGNVVLGNRVGTDASGRVALGNGFGGVVVEQSSDNIIGGTTARARNIISANRGYDNVHVLGDRATRNLVEGNYIGTDVRGTVGLGGEFGGVGFDTLASGNFVGTGAVGAGNLISGNATFGIIFNGADHNQALGNVIGLSSVGSQLGNTIDGVRISSADNAVAGNVISGNHHHGIALVNSGAARNIIRGNFIGTNVSGVRALGNAGAGVSLESGPTVNTIGGTTAADRNIISANQFGILLNAAGDSNIIQGDYIGTDITGNTALGNTNDGITLVNGPHNTIIGGRTLIPGTGAGNVISGNGGHGINLRGSFGALSGTTILGNLIGLNASGSMAVGNSVNGIDMDRTVNLTIGGAQGGERNVISGNLDGGIRITGPAATGNQVQGNFIGTDITGTKAVGNGRNGVTVNDGASGNTIGGVGLGNVMSGNTQNGVAISGAATGNQVEGNFIGTNAVGAAAIPNAVGVLLVGASGNTIGGTTFAAGNVISGNGAPGLEGFGVLFEGAVTTGNRIQGNFIGTGADGLAPMGNKLAGVEIRGTATGNFIGGTEPHAGNVIANTTSGPGVGFDNFFYSHLSQTSILGNAIYGNATHGIDLADATHPVIGSVTYNPDGTTVTISGNLHNAARTSYRLEFFSNPPPAASGSVQGKTFLGALDSVMTDEQGVAHFTVSFAARPEEGFITATTTDPSGNTSAFSPAQTPSAAAVNPLDGSGQITIRSATNTILNPVTYKDARQAGLADPPKDYQFPLGLLNFKVTGVVPGVPFAVTIDLPNEVSVKLAPGEKVPHYYKYGPTWKGSSFDPTPTWYDFAFDGTTGAQFLDTQPASGPAPVPGVFRFNQIILHLQKGARGDDDPVHEGPFELKDPGGVALPIGSVLLVGATGSAPDQVVSPTLSVGPGAATGSIPLTTGSTAFFASVLLTTPSRQFTEFSVGFAPSRFDSSNVPLPAGWLVGPPLQKAIYEMYPVAHKADPASEEELWMDEIDLFFPGRAPDPSFEVAVDPLPLTDRAWEQMWQDGIFVSEGPAADLAQDPSLHAALALSASDAVFMDLEVCDACFADDAN